MVSAVRFAAFPITQRGQHLRRFFRISILGLSIILSTLNALPYDKPPMTWGCTGSLKPLCRKDFHLRFCASFAWRTGCPLYSLVPTLLRGNAYGANNWVEVLIARYKSYTARQLIQYLEQHNIRQIATGLLQKAHKNDCAYQFWQAGVHPEPYSSARDYAGQPGLLAVSLVPTLLRGNAYGANNWVEVLIARYKSYTARQLIQYLEQHNIRQIATGLLQKAHKNDCAYQFWQAGVHPEPYSSARDYAGQPGLLAVCRQW